MSKFHRQAVWFAMAAAAFATALPAAADIYSFKDEKGIVHFTNIKGLDPRYKLIRKEDGGTLRDVSGGAMHVYMPSKEDIEKYSAIVQTAAKAYGVDASLVHAVISAESNYNPYAVSKRGAMGLMQLMPDTARRYGVQNMMDPVENIHGGVRYLRDLLAMFKGRLDLVIAAYNAGENAVIRYGLTVPPYAETRHYVPKVLGFYRNFQKRS